MNSRVCGDLGAALENPAQYPMRQREKAPSDRRSVDGAGIL
jgi:hypothetical protein